MKRSDKTFPGVNEPFSSPERADGHQTQVVSANLKKAPTDEPAYRFIDKKRSEGKPCFVYMTAGANKFLRIYYAR